MSSFDSPSAFNASPSKFESPSVDTLKRKGKRRMVNLVNPASMDDFYEPSLSLPDPSTAFLSPIRPAPQSGTAASSTSPQCAPPARLLRETTPVNDVLTPSWAGGGNAGGKEVLAGTPVSKGSNGSGGSSSSGSGMSSSRMSEYGAVKGILRPQGTPGSGNGVRFGQKNRFRVITPNNSMSTYGTPPRPAPAPAPAPISVTPIPPVPSVSSSPRTSFFSSLLSVVPISSPLRTSFARPSFVAPAPQPVTQPSTPGAAGANADESLEGREGGDESQGTVEQSWEVPGEEGEVSLIGSSTGDETRDSERYEEDEEEVGELSIPAVPWSGVPEVHSSPLALPSATGDTSKDISVQDLAPPSLSHSPRVASSPAATSAYSPTNASVPSPLAAPSSRRPRFSSGLHHVRNASTDSAALFNTRPSSTDIGSSAIDVGGDVSNLLSTTFEGMYGSTIHGMDTVDNSRMGMSFGSSMPGSPYPGVMAEEQEGDSSFGLVPPREDDEPTIRRRLSVHGGPTAKYDRSQAQVEMKSSGEGDKAEKAAEQGDAEGNPFAPVRSIISHSPDKRPSPDKSTSSLSYVRRSTSSRSISPSKDVSAVGEMSPSGLGGNLVKKVSISVDRERSRARSRSRSISPVKRDAPSALTLNSPGSTSPPAASATPQTTETVSPTRDLAPRRQPTPDSSPFSSLTPPSSDKSSNKFRSIFADMSAEQAQLQWPLQASTGIGGARSLAARAETENSPAGDASPSTAANTAPSAAVCTSGMMDDASEGSMSLSPLMLRSMRNGADVTNTTLPPRSTLPSASRPARTPVRLEPTARGDGTATASAGDKTAFFTPSSTPCPARAVVPFSHSTVSDEHGAETSLVQSASAITEVHDLLATLNLSGPSIALVEAQKSHSTALEHQVELFRNLARRLAEEVEERDRALAGVKVRLVQSEMKALSVSSRSRSESEEERGEVQHARVRSAHSRDGSGGSPPLRDEQGEKENEWVREELEKQRRDMMADLEAERANMRASEQAAREREITAQVEMQQLRSQLSLAQQQLSDTATSRQSPDGKEQATNDEAAALARAEDTIRDLEIRLRMSSEDVARERRERQKGMERAEELEVMNAEVKEQVAEWKDRAESGEVELADARDKLNSVMADVEDLKKRLSGAEGRVEEARGGLEEAGRELEKEKVASADLERIANELKMALQASQQEAKRLRAESSSKDLEISQLVRRKAELKEDREMLNVALASKQMEVELLKRKLARATKQPATNAPSCSSMQSAKPVATAAATPMAALGESHRTNLTELDQTPLPVPAHAQRVIDRQYDSVKPSSRQVQARAHGAGRFTGNKVGSIGDMGTNGKMPAFPETPSVVPGGGARGKVLVGSTVLKDRMLRRADAQQGQGRYDAGREGRGSIRATMGRESLPA